MSNPRLSIIPAGAVTDRSLEPRDLQVLCLLGRHTDKAGWCVRSQVRMAAEIDCSRGSLQNSLDRLSQSNWIEKKRRDTEVEEAGKHPSRSYAYRVLLDRDDFALESVVKDTVDDDSESYAETASEEGGCQPVGTVEVPTEQHPGANPSNGTRANPYVGTKNDPLERPPLERERDARAKDRKARFLVDFEARWPTAAADDRQRTAYAADELSEEEQVAALAGIAPFLENQKRVGRKHVPAGWKYLEERRWTLLDQPKADQPKVCWPAESIEARAILILHDMVRLLDFARLIFRQPDGAIRWPGEMTDRLRAVAQAPKPEDWVTLNRQQAAAWEAMLRDCILVEARTRLSEGSRAPWPWPPSVDGKLYASATGPPGTETLMSEQDADDFK